MFLHLNQQRWRMGWLWLFSIGDILCGLNKGILKKSGEHLGHIIDGNDRENACFLPI